MRAPESLLKGAEKEKLREKGEKIKVSAHAEAATVPADDEMEMSD